jgi:hypothetical protein
MIKNFDQFLNESYKSIGLGEPVQYSPGITYEISQRMIKINKNDYGLSKEEMIENIVDNTSLVAGEIYFDETEFILTGTTENGNVIYVEQNGEFDGYGGPYDPKMSKPKVLVNGKDVLNAILDLYSKYDGETYNGDTYPDMTRLDIYGYGLNKSETFFTSKRYGL